MSPRYDFSSRSGSYVVVSAQHVNTLEYDFWCLSAARG